MREGWSIAGRRCPARARAWGKRELRTFAGWRLIEVGRAFTVDANQVTSASVANSTRPTKTRSVRAGLGVISRGENAVGFASGEQVEHAGAGLTEPEVLPRVDHGDRFAIEETVRNQGGDHVGTSESGVVAESGANANDSAAGRIEA